MQLYVMDELLEQTLQTLNDEIGTEITNNFWDIQIFTWLAAISVFMKGLLYVDLSKEIQLRNMNSLEASTAQASASTYINVKKMKSVLSDRRLSWQL